jgi:predicted  nucleic acid-binding Zn-ribbon protein
MSLATIDEYKRKIDRARQDITTKKLELSQIDANISLIEQQLSEAKARKSHAEDYISTLEANIKIFEQNLTDEKNK